MPQIKKTLIFILILIISFSMTITVSADTVYTLSINQPRTDEYSGYIEYLLRDTNGSVLPFVTFWHITGNIGDGVTDIGTPIVDVTVTENRIHLSAFYTPTAGNDEFYFTLNGGHVNGYDSSTYWSYGSKGNNYINFNAYNGSGTILSYKIYGNFRRTSDSISSGSLNWNISYSQTSVLYETLLIMANSISGSNSEIIENVTENADKIQENQDENTQSIIDNQNQLQENEKNEASSSANGSADDAASAVPDQSAGFISSLSNFVGSMSTTHTEAKLKLPETFIPKIGNLFPQTVLWQEQYIDFSEIVAMIPKTIMRIIQALTTIALIVYCYKELYAAIEYVLVMRRGGNE